MNLNPSYKKLTGSLVSVSLLIAPFSLVAHCFFWLAWSLLIEISIIVVKLIVNESAPVEFRSEAKIE
jgi:hypothetical protein